MLLWAGFVLLIFPFTGSLSYSHVSCTCRCAFLQLRHKWQQTACTVLTSIWCAKACASQIHGTIAHIIECEATEPGHLGGQVMDAKEALGSLLACARRVISQVVGELMINVTQLHGCSIARSVGDSHQVCHFRCAHLLENGMQLKADLLHTALSSEVVHNAYIARYCSAPW